jgi:hypothetical protein
VQRGYAGGGVAEREGADHGSDRVKGPCLVLVIE